MTAVPEGAESDEADETAEEEESRATEVPVNSHPRLFRSTI